MARLVSVLPGTMSPVGHDYLSNPGLELDHESFTSSLLPLREVAMMDIIEKITDKPDWHQKVFDEEIVGKWKEEAMAVPDDIWVKAAAAPGSQWDVMRRRKRPAKRITGVISEKVWEYCVKELQSKARYFEKSSLIPTLDASASVVKSDTLIDGELRDALKRVFKKLQTDQADSPDWHPNSNDMVQNLIHPSLYPLVYERSKGFQEDVVGVENAIISWAGKGEVIPENGWWGPDESTCWSKTYQWLPSNVAFQQDGKVKFTSYINNLHPNSYPDIYSTIEELVDRVLPAWNQCIWANDQNATRIPGRESSRFATPKDADDDNKHNWNPPNKEDVADVEIDLDQYKGDDGKDETERKWKILRTPVLREPKKYREISYTPSSTEHSLFERFKDTGLQIIVKLASIELTPEKPEFPAGGWHVEGKLNERICATALFYLDSENITESSLSFRINTDEEQEKLQDRVGQDAFTWMECNYVTKLRGGCCIQNYGTVNTPAGRLLAFPNVFQHRVLSFKLADPSKPGYRRFIALWLVDPYARIISTAQVPPQQLDWWAESVVAKSADSHEVAESQEVTAGNLAAEVAKLLREKAADLQQGTEKEGAQRLSPELMELARNEGTKLGLMTLEEARKHRLKLMAERTAEYEEAWEEWTSRFYSFCEH